MSVSFRQPIPGRWLSTPPLDCNSLGPGVIQTIKLPNLQYWLFGTGAQSTHLTNSHSSRIHLKEVVHHSGICWVLWCENSWLLLVGTTICCEFIINSMHPVCYQHMILATQLLNCHSVTSTTSVVDLLPTHCIYYMTCSRLMMILHLRFYTIIFLYLNAKYDYTTPLKLNHQFNTHTNPYFIMKMFLFLPVYFFVSFYIQAGIQFTMKHLPFDYDCRTLFYPPLLTISHPLGSIKELGSTLFNNFNTQNCFFLPRSLSICLISLMFSPLLSKRNNTFHIFQNIVYVICNFNSAKLFFLTCIWLNVFKKLLLFRKKLHYLFISHSKCWNQLMPTLPKNRRYTLTLIGQIEYLRIMAHCWYSLFLFIKKLPSSNLHIPWSFFVTILSSIIIPWEFKKTCISLIGHLKTPCMQDLFILLHCFIILCSLLKIYIKKTSDTQKSETLSLCRVKFLACCWDPVLWDLPGVSQMEDYLRTFVHPPVSNLLSKTLIITYC
ncbi:hypothetical protein VP01_3009g1 [Puccinia sorghi]|uniref:Uncharacterized protein n=1 Tax=Puccinia sorghi TaxID=27349 RepID=A0A0L6V089_9BASI|nr:hypothetical protein VP01_3009g1 [Puccinia sorghi]